MADTPHLPSAPSAPGAQESELEARIARVEERLVARQQRLRSQWQGLQQRAAEAVEPRGMLLKLASVAVTGGGLAWALRRRARPSFAGAPAPALQAGAPPQFLLLTLLPMAWPLLPQRWRNRVSPATAATVLGIALPLLSRLWRSTATAGRSARLAPPVVRQLDLQRYAGTWHEQARISHALEPLRSGQPRVHISAHGDRLSMVDECRGSDGVLRQTRAVARVVPGSGGAKLQVTSMPGWLHWLPWAWKDLWVLHVDESVPDYRVAIAGHPSRQGLWLLSREPRLPPAELQRLMAVANELGYDTRRLVPAGPPAALH